MKIKVIGIGGAGCNTISRLSKVPLKGVELFAVNTDSQILNHTLAPHKLLIGEKTTGGLGAGMDWKLGEKAARESEQELTDILKGAEIVFLTAGLGGGSGTPGISVLGEIAKKMGVLTIAICTLPFAFEGALRKKIALQGLKKLQKNVDAFLVIPNDKVLKIISKEASVEEAFSKVDEVLLQALRGISDFLSLGGIISVDFADLEEVLRNSGKALFGQGIAKGEHRAIAAASKALQSPLLDYPIKKAKGILFSVSGKDVSLSEVNTIANFIKKIATQKTKIIFGVSEDRQLDRGALKVSLIATGID
jgi:cell division protein FtsZ